jgi:hypothetical protein
VLAVRFNFWGVVLEAFDLRSSVSLLKAPNKSKDYHYHYLYLRLMLKSASVDFVNF